jgi:WS/DGAT/MGAT family acyltransferase
MSYSHSDRLSALDSTFLALESPRVHMHVGSVAIFDGAALLAEDGSLDFERIRGLSEPTLRRSPRFRQRLARIPLFDDPVWVDDASFNLDYHLRHTSLPEPGDERQLKRLAGRIFSQKLDLSRPLWELWFVEGLEGGRIAVISKVHHCMVDGIAGVDLMAGLMMSSEQLAAAPSGRWMPRPAPSGAKLLAGELARRASFPARVAGVGLRALGSPLRSLGEAGHALASVGQLLAAGLSSASSTPLNDDVGPHRRFDWTRMDIAALKEVKARFGCTLNDVVLAIVSGAMRQFLQRRGVAVGALDFRAMVPVSVRRESERGQVGNRVVTVAAALPVDERDPARRIARVLEATRRFKTSGIVEGGELLEGLGDLVVSSLIATFSRLAARTRSFNLIVTNVPGPQTPLRMLGAKMEAVYPLVPLFTNQCLGIALFSYDGGLYWGLNADWDAVPDLHELVGLLQQELEVLRKLDAPVAP